MLSYQWFPVPTIGVAFVQVMHHLIFSYNINLPPIAKHSYNSRSVVVSVEYTTWFKISKFSFDNSSNIILISSLRNHYKNIFIFSHTLASLQKQQKYHKQNKNNCTDFKNNFHNPNCYFNCPIPNSSKDPR